MRTNWVTNEGPLGIQFEVEVRKELEGNWKTGSKRWRKVSGREKKEDAENKGNRERRVGK
jgi:hypothetical protein